MRDKVGMGGLQAILTGTDRSAGHVLFQYWPHVCKSKALQVETEM